MSQEREVYGSEFASVEVRRDERGSSPRLHVRDPLSSQEVFLDPLLLQALTLVPRPVLEKLILLPGSSVNGAEPG